MTTSSRSRAGAVPTAISASRSLIVGAAPANDVSALPRLRLQNCASFAAASSAAAKMELLGQSLKFELSLALTQRPQAQRIELDEARRVAMVVGDCTLLEGDEIPVVERVSALAPDHRGRALVELEPHPPGDE